MKQKITKKSMGKSEKKTQTLIRSAWSRGSASWAYRYQKSGERDLMEGCVLRM